MVIRIPKRSRGSINLGAALALVCVGSTNADASAIIKIDLGAIGPDIEYASGVLSTVDDGDAATLGDQNTVVTFEGDLEFLTDLLSGASFSLLGVTELGAPATFGPVVNQATQGGTFALYGADNSLQLSGTLDQGVLSSSSNSSTGGFFSGTSASFTGGALLAYLAPTPAGLSLALNGISPQGGGIGLSIPESCGDNCHLPNFVASGNGLLEGTAGTDVPEPASMALMLTGVTAALVRRRKGA